MPKRVCLAIFASVLAWAGRCDPPAQVAEFIRTLPDRVYEQHTVIQNRLNSSPDDFWLNRLFLETSTSNHSPVREKYRTRERAHPDSLDDEYLYERSLVGFNTKEALRIYESILAKNHDYPWVLYSQLAIYRSPVFVDPAKLRENFDAITRVCPAWIEPYRYLTDLDDDAVTSRAGRLRTMLEASHDPRELKLYSTLWMAEFRVRPKSEHDAERQRVAADLTRLRAFEDIPAVIANGAKLIGDDGLAKQMASRAQPPASALVARDIRAWQKLHPFPCDDDPPEQRRAYEEAALSESAKWIANAPDDVVGYSQRLQALAGLDAPAEQIAKAADDVVTIGRAAGNAAGYTWVEGVAALYTERGIFLDRVPGLIEESLTFFDEPEASDLLPPRRELFTLEAQMDMVQRHVNSLVTLSHC